jgi:hypothetical protein
VESLGAAQTNPGVLRLSPLEERTGFNPPRAPIGGGVFLWMPRC